MTMTGRWSCPRPVGDFALPGLAGQLKHRIPVPASYRIVVQYVLHVLDPRSDLTVL